MDLKKHVDTIVILGAVLGSFLWMNGKINEIEGKINDLKIDIDRIKTVLILQRIMPAELAQQEHKHDSKN